MDIPVTFEYEGKEYKGFLGRVAGGASASKFHLTVDNYHWGQLWFVEGHDGFPPPGPAAREPEWRFASNQHEALADLAEHFGWVVSAWYDSHGEEI